MVCVDDQGDPRVGLDVPETLETAGSYPLGLEVQSREDVTAITGATDGYDMRPVVGVCGSQPGAAGRGDEGVSPLFHHFGPIPVNSCVTRATP